jgi:hypothetical protein
MDARQRLTRAGAWAFIAAGVIAGAALCFHPDEFVPGCLQSAAWKPVHLALLAAFLLSVPGVLAVHLSQMEKSGALGRWAFHLAFLGSIVSVALVVCEALALPAIDASRARPEALMTLLDPAGPLGGLGTLFFSVVPVWILGYVLLGVAVVRAGVLPRRSGWLLIAAAVLTAVPVHFLGGLGPSVHVLSGLSLGAAWTWLGYGALTRTSAHQASMGGG